MFESTLITVLLFACLAGVIILLNLRKYLKSEKTVLNARERFLQDLDKVREALPFDTSNMLRTINWLRDAAEKGIVTQNNIACTVTYVDDFNQRIILCKIVDGYLYIAHFRFGNSKHKVPYAGITVEGSGVYLDETMDAHDVLNLFATYGKAELLAKQRDLQQDESEETVKDPR